MTDCEWEDKVWGVCTHIFGESASCSLLTNLIPKTTCSIHYHERRWNKFVVVSATIRVNRYVRRTREMSALALSEHTPTNYLGLVSSFATLRPGDVLDIKPGMVHSFEVIESGDVVEVYWCDGSKPEHDDIVRLVEGRVL